MNLTLLWLWMWFIVGILLYMLKRAYYGINPPNPIAHSYLQFIERAWAPLLIRGFVDSGIYWLSFYPNMFNFALKMFGIDASLQSPLPEYGVVALFFGMGIDSAVDFFVTKIPYVKDWLPQMPGPLPQEAVVQAQIVEQTTKTTQLQTTTTVIPPASNPSEEKP